MIKIDLISIIIPCYNYSRYLDETFNNLLKQSYTNFECIAVDDGSTDSTKDIVLSWKNKDCRIQYIYQTNKGLSSARNTGFRASRGEYIQFLDADDLLEKEKLFQHLSFLQNHPDCDLVYGDWSYFSCIAQDGTLRPTLPNSPSWKPEISGQGDKLLMPFVKRNAMVVSAPLVKRSLIERCCGFDESLSAHEDWDFWLQCIFAGGRFEYYSPPKCSTLIQLHPYSLSKHSLKMAQSALNIRNRIKEKITNQEIFNLNNSLLFETQINLALINIMHGNIKIGYCQLCSCLRSKTGLINFFDMINAKALKKLNKISFKIKQKTEQPPT